MTPIFSDTSLKLITYVQNIFPSTNDVKIILIVTLQIKKEEQD